MNASKGLKHTVRRRDVIHAYILDTRAGIPTRETGRGTRIDDYAKAARVIKKINKI